MSKNTSNAHMARIRQLGHGRIKQIIILKAMFSLEGKKNPDQKTKN